MADTDRLPGNWRRAMNAFASASEAVRQMILIGHPDWETVYTHFLGDALTAEWATAATNGTGAAVTVASSQLTCTSGTDDNGYAGQGFGLFWTGDAGIYFESEQALDTLATSKIEIGLTDATADAGAVNVKATPSATADDYCVFVRDTDDDTALDLHSRLDAGTASSDATDTHTVAAGTNFTTILVAQNDVVSGYVGSTYSNVAVVGSGSMQGGDNMTPWWFAQARAGTASRILTVEYAVITGPRA